ncbi:uncharacterized protein EDB93DRAFT_1240557 [Suillus bovinus]|uniref:uncharacterized protein n=1 Tax=Suillus bovinus TaxID=48563 RepID=UPI001B86DE65|nr:uncharacterized protein EDB93DRAFT_1240557 [Suillus bovinus]KAG2147837.1 hypothetical protein EDB93DRAFT_1240557 [Suillus bovinus]
MYPWPSKAHFITSLLFSSPQLLFSEAQKKAVLNWAKELGVQSLPSLGAMKKCQSHLQDLMGDLTEKVTSHSGNVFYINRLHQSPTCLAMQDYPEDGGTGMLQVFNGKKMLFDLPSPPAVQVDRTVYFTDKLLQESSGAAADTPINVTKSCEQSDKVLYALGRAIEWTDAGFIMSDDEEIIPTSMFI